MVFLVGLRVDLLRIVSHQVGETVLHQYLLLIWVGCVLIGELEETFLSIKNNLKHYWDFVELAVFKGELGSS